MQKCSLICYTWGNINTSQALYVVYFRTTERGVSMATLPILPAITIPDQFNAVTAFLDRNLAEGRSAKTAIFLKSEIYRVPFRKP